MPVCFLNFDDIVKPTCCVWRNLFVPIASKETRKPKLFPFSIHATKNTKTYFICYLYSTDFSNWKMLFTINNSWKNFLVLNDRWKSESIRRSSFLWSHQNKSKISSITLYYFLGFHAIFDIIKNVFVSNEKMKENGLRGLIQFNYVFCFRILKRGRNP